MPIYKTIHPKKNTTVYVWHITESFDELHTIHLNKKSTKRLNGMRSELHQRGFLSVRHLLKKLVIPMMICIIMATENHI